MGNRNDIFFYFCNLFYISDKMSRKKKEKVILNEVLIEDIAAEGNAVAHIDGKVLFVPLAVPGDVADIQVTRSKKNYMEGKIVRLVKASPHRLEPFCRHFGTCGGCRWQQLPYPMQLKAKQQQVFDQLSRIGHLELPEFEPVAGSDNDRLYRNKLEFTFSDRRWILPGEDPESLSETERYGLGFHIGGFFDKVLDIQECLLQKEPSNAIRLFIRQKALEYGIPFYDLRNHQGVLRNLTIRNTSEGEVMVILAVREMNGQVRQLMDETAGRFPEITSFYYVINTKMNDSMGDLDCILYKGNDAIYEKMEGLRFKIGPKSFYQTNSAQAYRLYYVAREFAALTGKELVYDLYTGTGTIAQFVSSKASRVIGIEYVPEAIEDARANCRMNGITNCDFFAGDMKDILTDSFIQAHGRPDVIILDPPRAGIHPDVADVILRSAPERIVYVSCNPASQARDLQILCRDYRIVRVRPVDMFPQTHHIENVVALERRHE